ncbi:WD40 repeat domain-containing protein [Actinoplanes sp. GCM10030250]|uniref:WD40 repeat domain-containing protein n=1 Tax=Actinoplanes sp. GCM10030250 TaxID=3273376 RepID=UPI0036237DE5
MLRRVAAGAAASLLISALILAAFVRPWQRPDPVGDVVPGGVSLPWMWQATVRMDPPGPASVLIGGDTAGFQGADFYDSEGKIAAVGRGGKYRTLLYGGKNTIIAGEDVLLSPDGRRAAQEYLVDSTESGTGLDIVDLTTGRSTLYRGGQPEGRCCVPVAWAPDGQSMLVEVYDRAPFESDTATMRLALLDLATDRLVVLGASHDAWENIRTASRGAFSPDGQLMAITEGQTVKLVDRTGKMLWNAGLPDRQYLAGAGAFSDDGTRIAIAGLDGCLQDCDEPALAARRWTIGYLDAATGRPATGPALATITGSAIRALGWSQGRDLVVLRYEPEDDAERLPANTYWNDTGWEETGHITLLVLEPGGGTRTLLDPPDGVLTMDVARDLLSAGHFGGPEPRAGPFPARSIAALVLIPLALALSLATGLLLLLTHHLRTRRPRSRRPA